MRSPISAKSTEESRTVLTLPSIKIWPSAASPQSREARFVTVPSAVYWDRLSKPIAWDQAFLIRAFGERLLKLFSEGKPFGTVHECIGQEFSAIATAAHLDEGDLIFR